MAIEKELKENLDKAIEYLQTLTDKYNVLPHLTIMRIETIIAELRTIE